VEHGRVPLDPGAPVAVAGGQPVGPQVGRLDHVVVDRDDPWDVDGVGGVDLGALAHRTLLTTANGYERQRI
jgi:hypothetical protein